MHRGIGAQISLTLWLGWTPPRFERYADGSAALFFGIGKVAWSR